MDKHGASEQTFLITQFYVNGFSKEKQEHLKELENGEYEIRDGQVIIRVETYGLPNSWETRLKCWERVKKLL